MTCTPFNLGNGVTGFVCTRGRRKDQPPCKFCPTQPKPTPSTLLCDGRLENGRTCDKPICLRHATRVGHNRDLCPACVAAGRGA